MCPRLAAVAMKIAKRGLRCGARCDEAAPSDEAGTSDDAESVFVFIFRAVIHVFEERFVYGGFADYVFFTGPGAEVEEFAAFAAKRKFGVGFRIRGLFADGAAVLHMLRIPQTAERCAWSLS